MTIKRKQGQERIIQEAKLQAEDVEHERLRRAQVAVTHIRELRKGQSLEGLKIKDLIEEGRM